MFYSTVLMTVLGSAVSALIMLCIIVLDQMEKSVAQAHEIAPREGGGTSVKVTIPASDR